MSVAAPFCAGRLHQDFVGPSPLHGVPSSSASAPRALWFATPATRNERGLPRYAACLAYDFCGVGAAGPLPKMAGRGSQASAPSRASLIQPTLEGERGHTMVLTLAITPPVILFGGRPWLCTRRARRIVRDYRDARPPSRLVRRRLDGLLVAGLTARLSGPAFLVVGLALMRAFLRIWRGERRRRV